MVGSLEKIALIARRHYRVVFLVAAVLVATSLALASRLRFDTDVLNLLPPDDPVVKTFRATLEEFGSVDMLLVAVRIPEGVPVDPYLSFVDELGPALAALPEIEYVDYRLGDLEDLLAGFLPKSLLFLDQTARDEVTRRLSEAGIAARAEEIRRLVGTPQAIAMKGLLQLDPFGLSEVLLGQMRGTRGALEVDWQSGYYLSGDRRLLLLLAKPVKPAQDIEFDAQLVAAVDGVVGELAAGWSELAGEDAGAPPEVALGGGYLIALDDASLIRRDVVLNVVSSFATVLLLFLFAFRRLSTLAYAFVPLACGIAITFGISALTLGQLSSATSGVAALLIGLAIDFVIVSYGRFVEERQGGASLLAGLHTMCGTTGRGLVTGAATTAATFYAFAVTDFKGLREMGFLVGTGILVCALAVLILLPAMLAWSEDRHQRKLEHRRTRAGAAGVEVPEVREPRLFVHGVGATRLVGWAMAWPRVTLGVALVLTVVLGRAAFDVGFEDSIQNMRPKGNRGILVQDEVIRHFGSSFEQMMLVATAPTAGEVIALADRAAAGAEDLVRSGVLAGSSAITALLPPPARQAANLDWLASGRASGSFDPQRVRATMERELERQGLRVAGFARGLDLVGEALAVEQPIRLDDFRGDERTSRLVDRYVHATAEGWKSVVYLYPPPKVWKRQAPPEVTALARSLAPEIELTGVNVVSERLRTQVRKDAWVAGVLGTLLVVVLLAFDFRGVRPALFSLVPLVLGLVWMLGAMAFLGMKMNFMNIFVTTMIIGIGVDYGIHVVHRFRDAAGRDGDLVAETGETAKAVVLAALTTVVGFGSLSTSHYPGLQSMGWVAILGTMAAALASITVLPVVLDLARRFAARHRG